MSVFTLYSYIRTFRQLTYGIISYIKHKMNNKLSQVWNDFPFLYTENSKRKKNTQKKTIHTKIKKHSYTELYIKTHIYWLTMYKGYTVWETFIFGLFLIIWRDSKILISIILLHLPMISNWDRETRGPPQEWKCSLIWEGEGLDKGRPVRTLTPACSAARVSNLRQVEPT